MKTTKQLGMLLLITCLLATSGAQEKAVRTVDDLVLLDLEKFQELSFRLDHPQRDGRHPVIIFSHQRDGDQNSEAALAEAWAKHGYICITPTHRDLFPSTDSRQFSEYSRNLQQRVSDIRFILDSLEDIGRATLPPSISLDITRVGLAGREWGAQVVQILGGANLRHPETSVPLAIDDSRIRAFVILDPAEDFPELTLQNSSWETFYRPLMVTSVANDNSSQHSMDIAQAPIRSSPSGNKALLWIGVDPAESPPENPLDLVDTISSRSQVAALSFRSEEAPALPAPVLVPRDIVAEYALLFWDTYLRGNQEAKERLRSSSSRSVQNLQVRIEFRE